MTIKIDRALTLEEIQKLEEVYEKRDLFTSEQGKLLATAREAMKVVGMGETFLRSHENLYKQAFGDHSDPERDAVRIGLKEALKPFQQTGERCKHGVDGTDCFDCFPSDKA